MKKQAILLVAVLALSCMCVFALAGCGSNDKESLIGEWKVQGTEVTVVFSEDTFKMVSNDFDYSVDTKTKTITYTSGQFEGTAVYSFNDDKSVLTLEEDDGNGGTKTTMFDRVSSDGSAEPGVGDVDDTATESAETTGTDTETDTETVE